MKHKVSPWPFPSPSSEFQTNLTSTILISSNKGLSYSWCWRILDLTDVFFDFPGSSRSQTYCLKKSLSRHHLYGNIWNRRICIFPGHEKPLVSGGLSFEVSLTGPKRSVKLNSSHQSPDRWIDHGIDMD